MDGKSWPDTGHFINEGIGIGRVPSQKLGPLSGSPMTRWFWVTRGIFHSLKMMDSEKVKNWKKKKVKVAKCHKKWDQLNWLLSLKRYATAPTFPEFVDFLLNTEVCTAINIKETHNSWPLLENCCRLRSTMSTGCPSTCSAHLVTWTTRSWRKLRPSRRTAGKQYLGASLLYLYAFNLLQCLSRHKFRILCW